MEDSERLRLLHGPYTAPLVRIGDNVICEHRDRQVTVGGLSSGLIPWPTALQKGSRGIILCGGLVDAVLTESEIAVAYHWGVSVTTVKSWRRALGVGRVNEGTARLYQEYGPEKLPEEVSAPHRSKAGKRGGATRGDQMRGAPAHPNTREALLEAAKRPKSDAWKRQLAERLRGKRPPNSPPEWTPEEDSLLGTDFDSVVAQRLGRPLHGVRGRRRGLGIKAYVPEKR